VNETLCHHDIAEKTYKQILLDHPNYIDCYLRLGCMARDKGQIYEASDKFKDALQISNDDPDAWSLLGNLHLSKMEWGPAQKKFERILGTPSGSNDSYSLIAMGNVWLQNLQQPSKDKNKEKKYQDRAMNDYKTVLRNDPRNIWAANGIGAVLAHKGCIQEARDIFAQVREATAEFCDVWLNIAHIYVEQRQYISAIQMYENCLKKFFKHPNVEVLGYLARAYFRAGKLKEAKAALLKARRVAPQDTIILYNIALVLQKLASQLLRDEKSTLEEVLQAVHELGISHRYFQYLAVEGDKMKYDLTRAAVEARQCQDLLSQAQYHVARAKTIDEQEKEQRKRQHEEREKFRAEQETILKSNENERRTQLEEKNKAREAYREKMSSAIKIDMINDTPAARKGGGGRGGGRRRAGSEIRSSGEEDGAQGGEEGRSRKRKRDKKKEKDDDGKESKKERRVRKRLERKDKNKKEGLDMLSTKQKSKIRSKAMVSSDSSDSEAGPSKTKAASRSGSESANSDKATEGKKRRIGSSSGSRSRSRSKSKSRSKSDSRSGSGSRSRSGSKASRKSGSRSGSAASKSRSRSRSKSGSRSKSRSKSGSRSKSRSKSGSRSKSRSKSGSPARSRSGSAASKRSGSAASKRSGSAASNKSRSASPASD